MRFIASIVIALTLTAANAAPRAVRHRVTYDSRSLMIDGKRVYVWSGEFHYWRLPSPGAWRDVFQKMRAAGFNAVSIYFDWGYHSVAPGKYDFSGVRNVDEVLRMAAQSGLYVIARPGPYINAETDSGGFPGWLQNVKGHARTSAPDYLAAATEWLGAIDPIIARHQLTNGTGTVILYQVENEYIGDTVDRAYMAALERKVRADGITVPLTHNSCCGDYGRWAHGLGAVNINGYDSYPQGFDCTHPDRWSSFDDLRRAREAVKGEPFFLLEYQGGAFDPWGGPGYENCRKLTGSDFESVFEEFNVAQGATLQNFYMTFGGTSWGWIPTPGAVYTSYDYGAIIDEGRALTHKYGEQKLLANEIRTLAPLTNAGEERAPGISDGRLHIDARVDPQTKAQFFIVRHANISSTVDDSGTFAASVGGRRYHIPVDINGRDSDLIVAGWHMGDARLIYTNSEIATIARIGNRYVALLFGRDGEAGRTLLRFPDRRERLLRYNYGIPRYIKIAGDGLRHPLVLVVASDDGAAQFWPVQSNHGELLVRGPYLVRSASLAGHRLALAGDTIAPTMLEVFAPPAVSSITWDGRRVTMARTVDGTLLGSLPGPRAVVLPTLYHWREHSGSPENHPGFDDSGWMHADRGTLYVDPYGFHYGDVWYRGRFGTSGGESSVAIDATTGVAGAYTVWLDGTYIGSQEADGTGRANQTFKIPPGTLHRGNDNTIAVLLENAGHNEDGTDDDYFKTPRGISSVSFTGGSPRVVWRIQGNLENDPLRGPMNAGGLYGERHGWYLPNFDDKDWPAAPARVRRPGVVWYRTTFTLHVPRDQDAVIALHIDDTDDRSYREQIYLNGWMIGRYVNDLGPETTFVLPNGILRTDGTNTLAIAHWSLDEAGAGLGTLSLKLLDNALTSIRIPDVR